MVDAFRDRVTVVVPRSPLIIIIIIIIIISSSSSSHIYSHSIITTIIVLVMYVLLFLPTLARLSLCMCYWLVKCVFAVCYCYLTFVMLSMFVCVILPFHHQCLPDSVRI